MIHLVRPALEPCISESFDEPVRSRGGQIVGRAGQSRRGPEQPTEQIGQDLHVYAVAFVLPAYITTVVGLLADRAPGPLKTLRDNDPGFVLLDGALAECDRVGDSRADYSAKHLRHGANVQVVIDPVGEVLYL